MENVPGLLKTRTASGENVIDIIQNSFKDVGYETHVTTLEAAHFGVPQLRKRLFVIGRRPGLVKAEAPKATHTLQSTLDLFESRPAVTLWDAISDLPQCIASNYDPNDKYISAPVNEFQKFVRINAPTQIHNHEPMRHTARIVSRFGKIAFGSSEADVEDDHRPRKRGKPNEISTSSYSQNSRRQHPDRPCNTVVASSHTNFIHPSLHRNFTVRELMRIQSFPDWFIVHGKRAVLSKKLSIKKGLLDEVYLDQRAQIGNAVPTLLAKTIANAIVNALDY